MTAETPQHPFYITTAIDYVNAAPHLGHAYEKMATDTIARAHRLMGHPTFFLSGTDEHGSKIEKNARQKGKAPKAFVDELQQEFTRLWAFCDVAYDGFQRTTDAAHYALVESLWNTLNANGDIYKDSYEGRYCSGCEAFLGDRDLDEEGRCLIHRVAPERVVEENYFFRLSKYRDAIKTHIMENPDFVQPEFRRNEVLNMLEELNDISVSRSRRAVNWGIPVPGDEEQVIYVWIDALSNYLTGLGAFTDSDENYQRFWKTPGGQGNAVHIIGKDILRFHAIYWPAMLMSAKLPLPKTIFAHGFITLNDAKISKSIGNVISPYDLCTEFELPHTDAVRYYLLTCTPFGHDGNFSLEEFKLKVNADLANNLGNLLNRTLSMVKKYYGGALPNYPETVTDEAFQALREVETLNASVSEAYRAFDFQRVGSLLLARVDLANRLINEREPWRLKKNGEEAELLALMSSILEALRLVAIYLQPLLPNLAPAMLNQLGFEGVSKAAPLGFDVALNLGFSREQPHEIRPAGPIMPRLDDELADKASKKKGV